MPQKSFAAIYPFSPGFKYCLSTLPPEILELAKQAMRDLLLPQIPPKYNFKRLDGNIHTITFGDQCDYRMSMGIRDNVAWLRRTGPYKEIEENP